MASTLHSIVSVRTSSGKSVGTDDEYDDDDYCELDETHSQNPEFIEVSKLGRKYLLHNLLSPHTQSINVSKAWNRRRNSSQTMKLQISNTKQKVIKNYIVSLY